MGCFLLVPFVFWSAAGWLLLQTISPARAGCQGQGTEGLWRHNRMCFINSDIWGAPLMAPALQNEPTRPSSAAAAGGCSSVVPAALVGPIMAVVRLTVSLRAAPILAFCRRLPPLVFCWAVPPIVQLTPPPAITRLCQYIRRASTRPGTQVGRGSIDMFKLTVGMPQLQTPNYR